MRTMRTTLLRSLALALLCASSLLAQGDAPHREGVAATIGLGIGSAGVSCDQCESKRETAPSLMLRIGGAYAPDLILGGEMNAWSKSEVVDATGDEARVRIATVNLVAQWYPQLDGGFFVLGGVGVGTVRSDLLNDVTGTSSSRTTAFGYQVGAGWDVRVTPRISVTPYATFFGTAAGKVKDTDAKLDGNVGQIGVGLTLH
jgi:opacity protein-like surface antigen